MYKDKVPLFSIGVTTYNRKDMLRQLLLSIINGGFEDFEVIVGNDYQAEYLTLAMLGINDDRIRIINHKKNLGELENMNSLLALATGKYFTWQFDDDLCAPGFLQRCADALSQYHFPECILTSYSFIYGTSEKKIKLPPKVEPELMIGSECLRKYLSGALPLCSLAGFFEAKYLQSIGGAKRLSMGHMALYTEYYLMVEVGLLPKVVYINSPLTLNRIHGSSFSSSGSAVELHKEAGINLIRQSIPLLQRAELKADFKINLGSFLKSVICAVIVKRAQQKQKPKVKRDDINEYTNLLKDVIESTCDDNFKKQALSSLKAAIAELPFYKLKARIKAMFPAERLKIVRFILSFISPYTNKSF